MLSAILKSEIATKVSINIMRTFVEMRKFIYTNSLMFEKLNILELKQVKTEENIENIFKILNNTTINNKYIFYNSQIYDAFSILVNLVKKAKKKIILIDNYIDIETLNILCKKNIEVEVIIYGTNKLNLNKIDINKFNKQYPTLKLKISKKFHDRFLIIDNKNVYHIGASIKDAGKKTFGITKWEDENIVENLLNKINERID